MGTLSELIQIRVTPSMKQAFDAEAERLKVRPVDLQRWALAQVLAHPYKFEVEHNFTCPNCGYIEMKT